MWLLGGVILDFFGKPDEDNMSFITDENAKMYL